MGFSIMEDLAGATAVKIHKDSCGHAHRSSTTTTKWHKASTLTDAEKLADRISKNYKKGWRRARCCMK